MFTNDCRARAPLCCPICRRWLDDGDVTRCPWCHADLTLFTPSATAVKPPPSPPPSPPTQRLAVMNPRRFEEWASPESPELSVTCLACGRVMGFEVDVCCTCNSAMVATEGDLVRLQAINSRTTRARNQEATLVPAYAQGRHDYQGRTNSRGQRQDEQNASWLGCPGPHDSERLETLLRQPPPKRDDR